MRRIGMIITEIVGGLGNQMFQYALGRRLSLARGVPHKLDISWFDEQDGHTFGLGNLRASIALATQGEVRRLTHGSGVGRFARAVGRRVLPYHAQSHVREQSFAFDPRIEGVRKSCYLSGYWQSEKYFLEIEERIRREFKPAAELSPDSRKVAELIHSTESVSIHVRRGDYVSNPSAAALHGVPLSDYYAAALALIAREVPEPTFFVFSDEPQWVADNMEFEGEVVVVDCNDASRNFEDLALMSSCRHNVIANSSFSWWGAWLNENPAKLVTAPRRWFLSDSRDTSHLIPAAWRRF